MNNRKKLIALGVATLFAAAGIADAIRYLQPAGKKQLVESSPITDDQQLIMVYNAYGGIYPGLADVIHKEFFPASYPCNLCYLAFGTFGKKQEWTHFIDSLPYDVSALHKDTYMRRYVPADLQLPAVLISNGSSTSVLVTAAEINAQTSLAGLMALIRSRL